MGDIQERNLMTGLASAPVFAKHPAPKLKHMLHIFPIKMAVFWSSVIVPTERPKKLPEKAIAVSAAMYVNRSVKALASNWKQ